MKLTFTKILSMIFATLIISFTVVSSTAIYFSYKKYSEENTRNTNEISNNLLKEQIKGWFKNKESLINNFEFTISEDLKNRSKLARIFKSITKKDADVNDTYFADIPSKSKGGRFIIGSGWVPPETWDWHTRPWWKSAMKSGNVIYTATYVDAITGKLIITIAKKIKQNGKVIGVAATDIFIIKISVANMKITKNSVTHIVNGKGQYITNNDPKKVLKEKIYSLAGLSELEGSVTSGKNDFIINTDENKFFPYI